MNQSVYLLVISVKSLNNVSSNLNTNTLNHLLFLFGSVHNSSCPFITNSPIQKEVAVPVEVKVKEEKKNSILKKSINKSFDDMAD